MKKKPANSTKGIVIYQAKNGVIELRGDIARETVWATLDQIAQVFGRDKSVISRHFKNIFKEGELEQNSVVAKNATTATCSKMETVEIEAGKGVTRKIYEKSNVQKMHIAKFPTLTLLIAESNPHKKEQMIALVTQMLV